MIPKPSSCQGCPFYTKGDYYTPDTIVPDSKVMFIAQNPGPDEEAGHKLINRTWQYGHSHDEYTQVKPQPLIGATGQMFDRRFLPLANLSRSDVSIGNTIRCRPGSALGLRSDELPTITNKMHLHSSKTDIVRAIKHCKEAHLHVPPSVKVIVAMGGVAMYSLTGVHDITSWRGYALDYSLSLGDSVYNTINTEVYNHLLSDVVVYNTMHIAALYKGDNKKYFHATLQDFHKLGRLLSGDWPLPTPQWHSTAPQQWPKAAAFDTEYIVDNNELIRWSLCDTQYSLYCVEAYDTPVDGIPIQPNSTVIIQNALADIAHLGNIVDMSTVHIEDMMLAHSVLWTGEPHSLNYIASMYGAFNRYKHLISADGQEQFYSALDAYEPMYIWRTHFIPTFKEDWQSWKVYKKYRLPLIDIINRAQMTGVRLDGGKLSEVQRYLQDRLDQLQAEARLITGDSKFNLGGSKRVKEEIYGN